ncbi:MAG: helix-turn-helix domain-containing protein [Vicinamibacteraceae bacterium]
MDAVSCVTHRVDGELGCWTAVEWRPDHLRGVVERLWHFTGRTAHPRERVLPTGLLQVVVHLGERYGVVRDDGIARCPAVGMSGQQTQPFVIQAPHSASTVLGIEFTPAGAYRLLRRPLDALAGQDVDLGDLVGRDATSLADRCDAVSQDASACLAEAASWIETRLGPPEALDPAIAWIAGRIRGRRGNVAIGVLRDAAGLTAARLSAGFRAQVGITAKTYARIHRFHHAAARLRTGASPLTVALDAGYYDQPHLNAEFRELSGLTPAAFAASLGYETGVNVPER